MRVLRYYSCVNANAAKQRASHEAASALKNIFDSPFQRAISVLVNVLLAEQKGNPLQETICYKIGGTVFEIETSCGGTEPLIELVWNSIGEVKLPGDDQTVKRQRKGRTA
ncbi:MAG: hypothetical protein ACLVKK_07315 [Ruthenibacterium sp.]